jgi:hypothetical protein
MTVKPQESNTPDFVFDFEDFSTAEETAASDDSSFSFKTVTDQITFKQEVGVSDADLEAYAFVDSLELSSTTGPFISNDGKIDITKIFSSIVAQRARSNSATPFLGVHDLPVLREDYKPGDANPFVVNTYLAMAYSKEEILLLDCNLNNLERVFVYSANLIRENSPDLPVAMTPPEAITPELTDSRTRLFSPSQIDINNIAPSSRPVPPSIDDPLFVNAIIDIPTLVRNADLTSKDPRFGAYRQLLHAYNMLTLGDDSILAFTSWGSEAAVKKQKRAKLTKNMKPLDEV